MNFVVTLLVDALLIAFVLPHLKGFQFSGKFWPQGLLYALGLQAMGLLIGLAVAAAAVFTLGMALIIIVPALILGFWLLNAIQLKLLAHFFPAYLKLEGWKPAILAGLALMVVDMLVGSAVSSGDTAQHFNFHFNTTP